MTSQIKSIIRRGAGAGAGDDVPEIVLALKAYSAAAEFDR
jgi:hypothetical protein